MSKRLEKVAQAIQHELGDIIIKDIQDPNLKLVSITRVTVAPDLRNADVFFSSVKTPTAQVKESLQKAKGVLKLELVKRIRLKYMPDLHFYEDKGIEHTLKISRILKELEQNE